MWLEFSKFFIPADSGSFRLRVTGALDWVVCSSEQFCFQMCLECGDGSGTFSRWRR